MRNTLYTADNLFVLHGLDSQSVDLIYLDPPFNSKRTYSAPIGSKSAGASFKDMWTWQDVNEAYLEHLVERYPALVKYIISVGSIHSKAMMAYLTYMTQRIIEMHRVLKDTGSLYLHVDPTASHYLKVVLDEIFGRSNFRNEIVWSYSRWTNSLKGYTRTHDILLFYVKDTNQQYWGQPTEPFSPKSKHKGSRFSTTNKTGKVTKQEYVNKERKKAMRDVWDISILNSMSKERTGYPTQKPLALLERIIKASSNEDDVVLDPFCGCATTCVKAQQLGRKWIGVDIEKKAVDVLIDRLSTDAGLFSDFTHTEKIPKRTDIEELEISTSAKDRLYKDQDGICNGCKKEFDVYNLEIDHIIPSSKGGGDYYENYQLLCSNCNKVKGDRPMEYLRMKIKAREELLDQKLSFGD